MSASGPFADQVAKSANGTRSDVSALPTNVRSRAWSGLAVDVAVGPLMTQLGHIATAPKFTAGAPGRKPVRRLARRLPPDLSLPLWKEDAII
jgi:hypothetical protein